MYTLLKFLQDEQYDWGILLQNKDIHELFRVASLIIYEGLYLVEYKNKPCLCFYAKPKIEWDDNLNEILDIDIDIIFAEEVE